MTFNFYLFLEKILLIHAQDKMDDDFNLLGMLQSFTVSNPLT